MEDGYRGLAVGADESRCFDPSDGMGNSPYFGAVAGLYFGFERSAVAPFLGEEAERDAPASVRELAVAWQDTAAVGVGAQTPFAVGVGEVGTGNSLRVGDGFTRVGT